MNMAVNAVHSGDASSILGIREPKGEGSPVGFLKGSLEDKTKAFFTPLEQQLDGGFMDVQKMQDNGEFSTNIPYYIKGTTYNSTIMVLDEAEDLTAKQLKLIGTRIGEDSRLFISGDYKQSVINDSEANPSSSSSPPLVSLCKLKFIVLAK